MRFGWEIGVLEPQSVSFEMAPGRVLHLCRIHQTSGWDRMDSIEVQEHRKGLSN